MGQGGLARPARDRDAGGRPRSGRPRDAAGRPLPRGSAAAEPPDAPPPGEHPPDRATALRRAQDLIDAGHPFAAHEVLEDVWKAAPSADRDAWQGLTQLAVGLTHLQRGNRRGAVTLLRRGADRLATSDPARADLVAAAHGLADAIAAGTVPVGARVSLPLLD